MNGMDESSNSDLSKETFQMQSEAIRGNQRQSEAITCPKRPSRSPEAKMRGYLGFEASLERGRRLSDAKTGSSASPLSTAPDAALWGSGKATSSAVCAQPQSASTTSNATDDERRASIRVGTALDCTPSPS